MCVPYLFAWRKAFVLFCVVFGKTIYFVLFYSIFVQFDQCTDVNIELFFPRNTIEMILFDKSFQQNC